MKANKLVISCWILGGGLLLVLPSILGKSWIHLVTQIMIMALYAVAFNLVLGFTGMLTFGHAAFFGLGAYTCALLLIKTSAPMIVGLFAALIISGMTGLIMGLITVRLTGFFLCFITLGVAQLVWAIIQHSRWCGGADGIFGVPLMPIFYSTNNFYYLTLGIVASCLVVLRVIVNSPFGLTLKAIRDNPVRTEFVGVNYRRYRLASLTISALFTGIAGSLFALLNRGAYPELLYWTMSGEPVTMVILGGVRFFYGPLVGAILIVGLDKIVSIFTQYWPLTLGIIVLFIVLFLRGGIVGFVYDRRSLLKDMPKRIIGG